MKEPWPLRGGWQWARLREVASFEARQVDPEVLDPATPYIGLEHIEAGTGECRPSSIGGAQVTSAKHEFDESTLLYGRLRPNLNKVVTPSQAGVCSTDLIPIKPKAGIDRVFLALYLRSAEFATTAAGLARGELPRITSRRLGEIPIPVPPPSEQSAAVQLLELAELPARIARDLARDVAIVARDVYIRLVGPAHPNASSWPRMTLGDLAAPSSGSTRTGPFGSALLHSEFTDEGPVAVLGIDNCVENRFRWGEPRFITQQKYESLKRYTVLPGDVLVTIMGTTGRTVVAPSDVGLAISTKHLAVITINEDLVEPEFVSAAIRYDPTVRNQVPSDRGAVMDGLNLSIIKRLHVAVPPLELQRHYVRVVRSVQHVEEVLGTVIVSSERCFAAAGYRAFGATPRPRRARRSTGRAIGRDHDQARPRGSSSSQP